MSKIIQILSECVTVGLDDGSLQVYPISSCNGFIPEVGLEVEVYSDGTKTIIVKKTSIQNALKHPNSVDANGKHKVNKVAYVLLAFFLGVIRCSQILCWTHNSRNNLSVVFLDIYSWFYRIYRVYYLYL